MANVHAVIQTARAHSEAGRHAQAAAVLRRALQGEPGNVDLNNACAIVLFHDGQPKQALYFAERAAQAAPRSAPVLGTLGNILLAAGDFDRAAEVFASALRADPRHAGAAIGLANALQQLRRYADAVAACREALAQAPGHPQLAAVLSGALLHIGQAAEAVALLEKSLRERPDDLLLLQAMLFAINYLEDADPERVGDYHARYGRLLAASVGGPRARAFANDRTADRPLRIGYVSPDFRAHSVAYFAEPIIERRDRTRFQAYLYSTGGADDATTARLREAADGWREVGTMPDDALARRIEQDRIDILVDLSGHTLAHRLGLFARRAAPVQATFIGYPNTTGLPTMDYRLVDETTDPPGAERWCVERLVRLPGCFLCYRPMPDAPDPGPPPADAAGHVTFGSFNTYPKLGDGTVGVWTAALRAVPGSRLLLKNKQFADPEVRRLCRARFERAGLEPDRLELLGPAAGGAEHLALYNRVDVGLDTFPYNGATTTCEALWMGVPVVSRAGEVHASRVGLSLLRAAGLAELAAESAEAFVRTASELGRDRARLASLRASLRGRVAGSPLCDAPAYVRRVEAALDGMWRAWCEPGR